ncbi:MAG: hypothetical protein BWZ07_00745 [Alphaproteobacteria bacterium ADurb.BinA280]|nr:MAG: hypothetical protein BWZ07_00745 [Alphaproteobacteria bacterium ADurb.BinA280]
MLIELQMPARGSIHRDGIVRRFRRQTLQMRQGLLLRLLYVAKQGSGRRDGRGQVRHTEAGQVLGREEAAQGALRRVGIKQPRCAPSHASAMHKDLGPAIVIW